jgi:hypothetical protein
MDLKLKQSLELKTGQNEKKAELRKALKAHDPGNSS